MPDRSIASRFQALCTSLFGVLFSFRSPYYCTIGLKTYLALEVGDSQIPARIPTHGTQDETQVLHHCVYVTITLYGWPFQANSTSDVEPDRSAYNTTSPRRDSVWALPCSLAVNYGISIDFFSGPY